MPEDERKLIGWQPIGAILLVCALSAWAYNNWIIQPEKRRQLAATSSAEAAQRFQQWAYVAKEKEIAPGESVKLVVIPHSSGLDIMDTKCFVYTHREFKTSNMICPDARQDGIEETE